MQINNNEEVFDFIFNVTLVGNTGAGDLNTLLRQVSLQELKFYKFIRKFVLSL
jgi:hypothetical protein